MRALGLRILVCIALLLPWSLARAGPSAAAASDWDIPGGHFYTQAGGGQGGFAITDEGGIPFWTTFRRLGGVKVLGYPSSHRFQRDGFIYQATQAALLQWQPDRKVVVLANVFEFLEQAGRDDWLAAQGVPRPIKDDGSGGDFAKAASIRLSWLTEPRIAAVYFAARPTPEAAIERYGLPASRPERWGPFVAQRFQRLTLQLWVEPVPGMPPPGTVVPVLAGDLAKAAGLIPAEAMVPGPAPAVGNTLAVKDPVLVEALTVLRSTTRGTSLESDVMTLVDTVSKQGTRVEFATLPPGTFGAFSPAENTIRVSASIRDADRRAIAAVLYHELSHAYDHWSGKLGDSAEDCFDSEFFAFQRQAQYWRQQFGPSGRVPPRGPLETSLNDIADAVLKQPVRFVLELIDAYGSACV